MFGIVVGGGAAGALRRGLAYPLCRAVLAYAQSAGHRYVILKTQDFRLGAIKTYLRMGFEPKMEDPTHQERWEELQQILCCR